MAGDDGEAPDEAGVVRRRSCSEEAGAFLRAIPYNPHFLLSNADFKKGRLRIPFGHPT